MLRTEPLQLGKTGLQGFEVKLTSKREMVELMLKLKLFALEKSIEGCKKVVALGPDDAVGEWARPALDLMDLWKTSTFHRF